MFKYFNNLVNQRGDALVGYQVRLTAEGSDTTVPIFADNNGTPIASVSGIANVAFTDDVGNYSFFVEPGTYNLIFSSRDGVFLDRVDSVPMKSGPRGDDGADAVFQRYDFVAVPGQTRIPETGPLTDNLGNVFVSPAIVLRVNGAGDLDASEFDYFSGEAPYADLTDGSFAGGEVVTAYSLMADGSGGGSGDGVPLHSYPGTEEADDPERWEHNNAQLANALADTRDPTSPNFGKWVDIYPFRGAGTRHADEWSGDTPIAVDVTSGDPIGVEFLAQDGDTLIDSWSQNGRYEVETFPTPIEFGQLPGNLISGARIRLLPGARVRRAPRYTGVSSPPDILKPLILCCDPNATEATTDPETGIDTQSDVYRDIEIICEGDSAFIGENHRWGYREHHNDISLNGATNFRVETRHYGTLSDALYLGAGNVGGGDFNRHNKDGRIRIWADGRNQNNRNGVSIIDCVGLRGSVRVFNFSKSGGAGSDPYDPNSGVLAPGGVDVEPNTFTDDPHVDDIELDVYGEDLGSSAVSTLLIDNNVIPNPLGSMRFTGRAVRCKHGKHTLIGATNMATPYQIHVRMDAIDCEYPFEVLAGQGCTHEGGRNLRSLRAGQIGYTGFGAPQDFNRINEIDQELGSIDSASTQIRGWDGGGQRGGQVINGQTRGFHLLSNTAGSPIRDLILDGIEFINRTNITSQEMDFAWYVDPSDGGPQLFPGTITERDIAYNGIENFEWAVAGSAVLSIPGLGAYDVGVELRGHPSLEPGSPRTLVNLEDSASRFFVQDQKGGFVPDGTGADLSAWTLTNMTVNGGRLTANDALAAARSASTYANPSVIGKTPFSGTGTAYVGITTDSTPTSIADLALGVWFGNPQTGSFGRAIVGTSPSGLPFEYKYGDGFDITATGGGAGEVGFTPAGGSRVVVHSTGVGAGPFYVAVFINVAGETVFLGTVASS